MRLGYTNRVLKKSSYKWLPHDIPECTLVSRYDGITYGCIRHGNIAVVLQTDLMNLKKIPFLEVPGDSINWNK